MSEVEFQTARAAGFVAAVALACSLQKLRPHAGVGSSLKVNIGLWLTSAILVATICGACACVVARWAADAGVGVLNSVAAPGWVSIACTLLFLDLVSYAWHRANHIVPFLWRFHQVHHSDHHLTVSTAARFHPGELLLSLPVRLAAIVALGASPAGVIVFEIVFAFANLLEHGDIDLPLALERRVGRVFVVPAFHRRHHSVRPAELNTNFATVLIVWDRILGTFAASSSADRVGVGLPGRPQAPGLRDALLLPRRLTTGWR